jgi:2-polyprenyl-3-methyl-5-hydroxy-6-metoxy-1,4-benzoquinol methylase
VTKFTELRPGMQTDGTSSEVIYQFASRNISRWPARRDWKIADIGGGKGDFAKMLLAKVGEITVFDCAVHEVQSGISYIACDLNCNWPAPSKSFDAVVSLEVIEHVENPRHFAREMARILKRGGYGFVSTPNQLSFASKACLLFRDQFQHFQNSCYPDHITALVPQDVRRVFTEAGLIIEDLRFTDNGRIPFTNWAWQIFPWLGGKWFSDNVGVSVRAS